MDSADVRAGVVTRVAMAQFTVPYEPIDTITLEEGDGDGEGGGRPWGPVFSAACVGVLMLLVVGHSFTLVDLSNSGNTISPVAHALWQVMLTHISKGLQPTMKNTAAREDWQQWQDFSKLLEGCTCQDLMQTLWATIGTRDATIRELHVQIKFLKLTNHTTR